MTATVERQPPAASGPDARPVRCQCGNLLGFRDADWLHIRHKGRAVVSHLPARVQCERCGRRLTIDTGAA